jgi:hypothetical protein
MKRASISKRQVTPRKSVHEIDARQAAKTGDVDSEPGERGEPAGANANTGPALDQRETEKTAVRIRERAVVSRGGKRSGIWGGRYEANGKL